MSVTTYSGRQRVLVAEALIDYVALAAGAYTAINLPLGAQVVGGHMVVDTVFNSTTNTLSIGDASSAARYLGATDIKTAARTALVPTGFRTTITQPAITVTHALTGTAPTQGSVRLIVQYIVDLRADENQD